MFPANFHLQTNQMGVRFFISQETTPPPNEIHFQFPHFVAEKIAGGRLKMPRKCTRRVGLVLWGRRGRKFKVENCTPPRPNKFRLQVDEYTFKFWDMLPPFFCVSFTTHQENPFFLQSPKKKTTIKTFIEGINLLENILS